MFEHKESDDVSSVAQLLLVKRLEQNLGLLRALHDERLAQEFLLESGGSCNVDKFTEWYRKRLKTFSQ